MPVSNYNKRRIEDFSNKNTCLYCYHKGHTFQECTVLERHCDDKRVYALKFLNKHTAGRRVCAYCADATHTSTFCPIKFNDIKASVHKDEKIMIDAYEWLKEIGFGEGAMLSSISSKFYYRKSDKQKRALVIEAFNSDREAIEFVKRLTQGKNKKWFHVKATDTSFEGIRQIHLPYHEVFSPSKASKDVEVLCRASDESIESFKKYFTAIDHPILKFDDAKSFFDAGYRLSSGQNINHIVNKIHA